MTKDESMFSDATATNPYVEALVDVAGDIYTLHESAKGQTLAMLPDELRAAATLYLVKEARREWRTRNAATERQSERRPAARRAKDDNLFEGKYRHGSVNKQTGAVPRGCDCKRCEDTRRDERAIEAKYAIEFRNIMDTFVAAKRMEWTAELLTTGFALPDGSTVTWGDATESDHQRRIDQLESCAMSTMDTAARHHKAIETLHSTGAATLNEAVTA